MKTFGSKNENVDSTESSSKAMHHHPYNQKQLSTKTVLRLLLSLSDKVHQTFNTDVVRHPPAVQNVHRITQSVEATGGVYKGQGRNRHELMTRAY